ncbi:polyprotein [Phytophthora megakarya]|uniref:Polyprotein n=1 Tax=Phytophthora megakarya TaxID=4795 RepID=A0A225W7L5_9STRA|nr:polyprotein [Phytophthora megakarya]
MPRRLHEFNVEKGTPMAKPFDAFDELVIGLQTWGEPVDEARIPAEYKTIMSIVENTKDIEFNEKLLKEQERLQ